MRVFKNNTFNIPSGNFTHKGIYGESNNQILIQNNIFTSSSGSGQAGLELRNYPPGNSNVVSNSGSENEEPEEFGYTLNIINNTFSNLRLFFPKND